MSFLVNVKKNVSIRTIMKITVHAIEVSVVNNVTYLEKK